MSSLFLPFSVFCIYSRNSLTSSSQLRWRKILERWLRVEFCSFCLVHVLTFMPCSRLVSSQCFVYSLLQLEIHITCTIKMTIHCTALYFFWLPQNCFIIILGISVCISSCLKGWFWKYCSLCLRYIAEIDDGILLVI